VKLNEARASLGEFVNPPDNEKLRGAVWVVLLLALLALATVGCDRTQRRVSPETARSELAMRGIAFDAKQFVLYAADGDVWAVRLFLAAGMSPDVKDERGATPLVAAMMAEQYKVALALLEKNQNVNVLDRGGMTPLTRAVDRGQNDLVKLMIARGADLNLPDRDGWTPLMFAARRADEEITSLLLERGADVNARDNAGATALQWAAYYGNLPLARGLLARGANANAANKSGGTPLMVGAAAGRTEVVGALLDAGARVETKDDTGLNSEQWAEKFSHAETAELIRRAGKSIQPSAGSRQPNAVSPRR
jgi:ankyrin repeat protein